MYIINKKIKSQNKIEKKKLKTYKLKIVFTFYKCF